MSKDDLIERLGRYTGDPMLCDDYADAMQEAADALTAQTATITKQARELEALRADAERHSKATLMLSGMFSRNCMAMQAALADMMLRGHEQGWQWIINSLDGPGLLPDMAEVKAAGGAQAWFDAELAEEEARVAAMQSGKAAEPDATKCRKCNGNMRPGTYLEQTFSGVPDFPGDTHAVTVSPSGPGRLAECLKCDACGHSVTAGKAVQG